MRTHLRHNIVGYVALFFSLGLGTAWASHEQIFSNDIVNGEVKKVDVGNAAVGTAELVDEAIQKVDVANAAVGTEEVASGSLHAIDVNSNTFRSEDIAAHYTGFFKQFGIPTNAIQSHEIQNGQVMKEDLASNAGPVGRSMADGTPGPGNICNNGCTEGKLALPAGSYAIFAKIGAFQLDVDEDLLHVVCELDTGTDKDTAIVRTLGDTAGGGPLPTNAAHATLSMQLVHDYSSAGNAAVNCEDQDVGDARSRALRITAIELGSTP